MTFIHNPDFEREFNQELSVRAGMLAQAEKVKVAAEAIAPEGPTGDYGGSIEVHEDAEGAYVTTVDPAGHIVEWGSVNNPPYAVLRRGVRVAGLDLHEVPKP